MRVHEPRVRTREGLRQAAVLWTGGVRLGLWLLPLPWLRRAVVLASDAGTRRLRAPARPAAVGAAVRAAGGAVPRATCLVQALAAWGMLRGHGRRPTLRLGLSDPTRRPFRAHAWVECDGFVVVGGDVSSHRVLGTLPLEESVAGTREDGARDG